MVARKRMKRSTRQYLTVAIICIIVIGGAAIFTSFIITGQIREEYEGRLQEAYAEMKANKRRVFVANADIKAGEYITEHNVEESVVYASQPAANYSLGDGVGKIALVDIPSGTQIISSMLTEKQISSELREIEYDVIQISTNITDNDTVDIRLAYPNGESYIVLCKKRIQGLYVDTATCFLWLDEAELLRMSAAIVDAGLYPGSSLYVTKYIEPSIQGASQVNYVPSLSVLSLLEKDPNILERCSQELNKNVRKALENRLAASMDLDVSEISWDIHPNHVPASEVISTNQTTNVAESTINDQELTTKMDTNQPIGSSSQGSLTEEDTLESEMGKIPDYVYYAQEELAKEGDVEYGE